MERSPGRGSSDEPPPSPRRRAGPAIRPPSARAGGAPARPATGGGTRGSGRGSRRGSREGAPARPPRLSCSAPARAKGMGADLAPGVPTREGDGCGTRAVGPCARRGSVRDSRQGSVRVRRPGSTVDLRSVDLLLVPPAHHAHRSRRRARPATGSILPPPRGAGSGAAHGTSSSHPQGERCGPRRCGAGVELRRTRGAAAEDYLVTMMLRDARQASCAFATSARMKYVPAGTGRPCASRKSHHSRMPVPEGAPPSITRTRRPRTS